MNVTGIDVNEECSNAFSWQCLVLESCKAGARPWANRAVCADPPVAAFGRLEIMPSTAFGASEKIGRVQISIFEVFEMLRFLRKQEIANTVFAALERLRVL